MLKQHGVYYWMALAVRDQSDVNWSSFDWEQKLILRQDGPALETKAMNSSFVSIDSILGDIQKLLCTNL